MIRALPLLLALAACTAPIEIPPPPETAGHRVTYERGHPDAIASAYPYECRIVVDDLAWDELPGPVRVYVLAHELCHLGGIVDEVEADCCALRWMDSAGYLPPTWGAAIVCWAAQRLGAARAGAILECER